VSASPLHGKVVTSSPTAREHAWTLVLHQEDRKGVAKLIAPLELAEEAGPWSSIEGSSGRRGSRKNSSILVALEKIKEGVSY
jgi:hypothetical protein